MGIMRRKATEVMGHTIRSPRLTGAGAWWIVSRLGLPLLAVLALLDGILYLYFKYIVGICYGFWCWF